MTPIPGAGFPNQSHGIRTVFDCRSPVRVVPVALDLPSVQLVRRNAVKLPGRRSRLANVATTLRLTAKRLGWRHTLLWSCASLGRRFSAHIFVVTTHPIDGAQAKTSAELTDHGLEPRLLTSEEVLRFFNRDTGDDYVYSSGFAAEALARGDRCFGVLENGRLLSYCWYARESAPVFDDVDAVVDAPFLYAYNAYTHPAHRGRGLHQIGVNASARFFAREGVRAITAYIEANNLPPLIAARKMGEEAVGWVALYRARGKVRWVATPGCRRGGFRIRRRSSEAGLRRPADEDRRAPA